MLLERRQRIGLVVLGAHGEDDAALGEIARIGLERDEGFAGGAALAEHDAFETVIADDAAPQRVVEIEHQALRRAALLGGKQPADEIAVERRGRRRHLLLGAMPEHRIVPAVQPVLDHAGVESEKVDAGFVGEMPQGRIDFQRHALPRAGKPMLVIAEERREDRQYGLLDDRAFEGVLGEPPAFLEMREDLVRSPPCSAPHWRRCRRRASRDRRRARTGSQSA